MNSCQKLSELFSEYVERSLHEEVRHEVEIHLKACPPCLETVERLGRLRRNLKSLSAVKASPDFEMVLRTRMRLERHRLRPWTVSMPLFPARAMAYGLLVVGVVGGGMLYMRYASKNSPAATPISSFSNPLPATTSQSPIQSTNYQRFVYTLDGVTNARTPGAALSIKSKGIERYQIMSVPDSSAANVLSANLETQLISF